MNLGRMSYRRLGVLALAMGCVVPNGEVIAAEYTLFDHPLEIRGYGTLAYARTNTDESYLISAPLQNFGASRTQHHFATDSALGLQASLKVSEQWSATAQVLAKRTFETPYADLWWGYASWQPTDNLTVRVGRIRPSWVLYAETVDVGYSQPWLRAPLEVYGAVTKHSLDGGILEYRGALGAGWRWEGTLMGGRNEGKSVTSQFANVTHGVTLKLTSRNLTFIGGIRHSEANAASNSGGTERLLDAAVRAGYGGIAEQYRLTGLRSTIHNLGAVYEEGPWWIQAEHVRQQTERYGLRQFTGSYWALGYRIGAWQPYVIAARARHLGPDAETAAGAFNSAFTAVLMGNLRDQSSLALGVRYDIAPNWALKAQYDRIRRPEGSGGYLIDIAGSGKGPRDVRATTVAVDFVF